MGLCERCEKSQATFHLTNIEPDGEKSERHLCDDCAGEEGYYSQGKSALDISEFLDICHSSQKVSAASELICEECGISYLQFRKQGLLGCPNDYEAFREPLAKLLRNVHDGANEHVGKAPGASCEPMQSATRELRIIRKQLDEAVKAEDYERAAKLRDRIAEMESA